ncbi:MAG: hypothetical protein L6R36_000206 [Xanthoria steineri]|nr:MAG: hypothetical protein L6R36_000206 [Xanthoria steineri]
MAPTGSRTPSLPLIVSSIIAVLVMLSIIFHSNIISAFQDLESNHHQPRRITTVFQDRPILENLSPSANEEWERALLTPRGGFLWVQYNITAEQPYGISMFHGLHCLKMLREVIQSSHTATKGSEHPGAHKEHGQSLNHIRHCIGYIAQHLMCAADSTIGPSKITFDQSGQATQFMVDGEGYQHQCRDHSGLRRIVQQSEKQAVKPWEWKPGDTVESVWPLGGRRRLP